jgi:hypothetical protein
MSPNNPVSTQAAAAASPSKPALDVSELYQLRCIKEDKEIGLFLDHLGIVFGVPKAPGVPGAPRGLFQDHWEDDPEADMDGVMVAIPKTQPATGDAPVEVSSRCSLTRWVTTIGAVHSLYGCDRYMNG